jgi:hypothetical protein
MEGHLAAALWAGNFHGVWGVTASPQPVQNLVRGGKTV